MFFMMGVTTGKKDLPFHQTMVCSRCGRYGSYSVYMTYFVLSLFFIPVFRWNRRYYVTTNCCHATYQLDPEPGRLIARGEQVEIRPEDLTLVSGGGWYSDQARHQTYDNDDNEDRNRADQRDYDWYKENEAYISDGHSDKSQNNVSGQEHCPLTKECSNCGFAAQEDFIYCPRCGKKL